MLAVRLFRRPLPYRRQRPRRTDVWAMRRSATGSAGNQILQSRKFGPVNFHRLNFEPISVPDSPGTTTRSRAAASFYGVTPGALGGVARLYWVYQRTVGGGALLPTGTPMIAATRHCASHRAAVALRRLADSSDTRLQAVGVLFGPQPADLLPSIAVDFSESTGTECPAPTIFQRGAF